MSKYDWPGPNDEPVVIEMIKNPSSSHWEQCRSLVSKIVGLRDLSEDIKQDIVQEAMLSIIRKLPDFRFDSKLTTWLIRITQSKITDAFRRQSRKKLRSEISLDEPQSISDPGKSLEISTSYTTEDECILREDIQTVFRELQKVLEQCSERNKEIIKRHFQDEQKYSEIADDLGLNPQVVAYVCNRTRQVLRKACQPPLP